MAEADAAEETATALPTEIWWDVLSKVDCNDVLAFKDVASWARGISLSKALWRGRREVLDAYPAPSPTAHAVRVIPFIRKLTLTGDQESNSWNHVKVRPVPAANLHGSWCASHVAAISRPAHFFQDKIRANEEHEVEVLVLRNVDLTADVVSIVAGLGELRTRSLVVDGAWRKGAAPDTCLAGVSSLRTAWCGELGVALRRRLIAQHAATLQRLTLLFAQFDDVADLKSSLAVLQPQCTIRIIVVPYRKFGYGDTCKEAIPCLKGELQECPQRITYFCQTHDCEKLHDLMLLDESV